MIIKTDQASIQSFLEDASGLTGAHTEKVYLPENYNEVQEILQEANSKKTSVTISGGRTGVVGGCLPFGGEVMSFERLNKILKISGGSIIVQSGVLLSQLKEAAESENYFYPPDPTEPSATLGGNISTNASGSRSFKYGSTRRYVKKIKIVLANGEIFEIERGKYFANNNRFKLPVFNFKLPDYRMPEIKNSSGYFSKKNMDLIDLFIGSEGTLGAVVEAELEILPKAGCIFGCFAFFGDKKKSLDFVFEAKKKDCLSIEYFDDKSLKLLRKKYPQIPRSAESCIFFEKETENDDSYLDDWAKILEKYNADYENVWISDNPQKEKEFVEIRHALPELVNEIVRKNGFPKLGTDIAVPENNFLEMLQTYEESLSSLNIDYLIFGHIGSSHLHVNMLPKTLAEAEKVKELYLKFVKKAVYLGGAVSAEHGIGKLKYRFLKEMYGDHGIKEMIQVKKYFDPNCVLGPDNIFMRECL